MFDTQTISLPCPKCGHQNQKRVTELNLNPRFTCGGCGIDMAVKDMSGLNKVFNTVNKSIDSLLRTVGRLGKR